MSAVPQPLLDGLTNLQADQDDVTAKTTAKAGTAAALAAAQTADTNAAHDLSASVAKQATDLAAYEALVGSTYGSTGTNGGGQLPAATP